MMMAGGGWHEGERHRQSPELSGSKATGLPPYLIPVDGAGQWRRRGLSPVWGTTQTHENGISERGESQWAGVAAGCSTGGSVLTMAWGDGDEPGAPELSERRGVHGVHGLVDCAAGMLLCLGLHCLFSLWKTAFPGERHPSYVFIFYLENQIATFRVSHFGDLLYCIVEQIHGGLVNLSYFSSGKIGWGSGGPSPPFPLWE